MFGGTCFEVTLVVFKPAIDAAGVGKNLEVLFAVPGAQRTKTSKGSSSLYRAFPNRVCLHCPNVASLPSHSKLLNQNTCLDRSFCLYEVA